MSEINYVHLDVNTVEGTVAPMAKRLIFCTTCRRFDPHTELIFVYPTSSCSWCRYVLVTCMFVSRTHDPGAILKGRKGFPIFNTPFLMI